MAHISGQTAQGNCSPAKYLGNNTYSCSPVPEQCYVDVGMLNQWFTWFAKVEGEAGETLHMQLDWPEYSREKDVTHRNNESFLRAGSQAVFMSFDRVNWKRIADVRVQGWSMLFDVTLAEKTAWLSVNLYHTPAMFADLHRALACSPFVTRKVIGKAWAGEDIEVFVATDPSVPAEEKQIVYLQGAQHACEYSGPNVLDPLLRFLANATEPALALLRRYEFHVVPVLNVSSWALGRQEHLGVKNPNRDWQEFELPEPRAVDKYLRTLPKKPSLLLDLHNGWNTYEEDGASCTVMDDLAPSAVFDGQLRFAELMMTDCDYLPPNRVWHNGSNPNIFKGYAQANYGYGFTMEFSRFNIYDRTLGRRVPLSQAAYRRFAVQLLHAVDKFLG